MKVIKDEHGGVHWIIIYFTSSIFALFLLLLIVDHMFISFFTNKATEVIDDLNRDIYQLIDIEQLAFETVLEVEDSSAAYNLFSEGLKVRYNLSDSFEPNDNNFINGAIVIDQFEVVTQEEINQGYDDGYGRTLEFPGIITEVSIPVRTPMLGIEGEKKILVTTEIYR